MSFFRAARAALAGQSNFPRVPVAVIVVVLLAGFSLSCGGSNNTTKTGPSHNAYVTLPAKGSVLQLHINGANGAISLGSSTPQVQDTSPTGLALLPSKKFLYVVNSGLNSGISIFNVASDGSLTLSGTPTPAGNGPDLAVIDPSGKYLLVTNNFGSNGSGGDISVYSIDSGTGALTEVAGSPFPANANPTSIVFTHSGKFVYVTNPGIGRVTGFSFTNGVLTPFPQNSSVFSGAGAAALAVDGSDRFLYVANPAATNQFVPTIGNISGFNIDPNTGELTSILGSPFTSTVGTGPSAITVDPSGRFVYATTPGGSFSIWCFAITPNNGQLTAVTNSPFSLTAGGQFALIDPSGNYLYIGSSQGGNVAGYTYDPSTGAPKVIAGSPFTTGAPGAMALSE
jgi:6-phosphogluconolactonase (cycloisomerase 2 family)